MSNRVWSRRRQDTLQAWRVLWFLLLSSPRRVFLAERRWPEEVGWVVRRGLPSWLGPAPSLLCKVLGKNHMVRIFEAR